MGGASISGEAAARWILQPKQSLKVRSGRVAKVSGSGVAITLSEANKLVDGAIRRARSISAHVSVSVCDPSGHLIAHQRMDGASADASWGSIGKAVASAEEGRPSGEALSGHKPFPQTGLVTAMGAPHLRRPGGLPVFIDGALAGAIGVSGAGTNSDDEDCARAGVAALAPK
jgi:glc operon protein GlcG